MLPCQNIVNYSGAKKQLPLPPSFSVSNELLDDKEKQNDQCTKQFLINCIRNGILSIKPGSDVPTWTGCTLKVVELKTL